MLFKRINRDLPETIHVAVQNNIGSGTAVVKDQALELDLGASLDGVKVRVPTTAGRWCTMGVADAAIAGGDYGLAQVYGYRASSIIFQTDTTMAAGLPLIPVNAVNYLATQASSYTFASNTTVSVTQFPYMAMLVESVTSSTASATVSAKIFLRAI